MEFLPKTLVVGVFSPTGLPGTPDQLTLESINRAWSEVATRHRFTQLQIAPDGSSANFMGATPDDGVLIQPPVLQFRSSVRTSTAQAGDDAQDAMVSIARHLNSSGFQQLGIRLVHWATLPDNDGPGYVLRSVFSRSTEDFAALRGGGVLMAGAKFIVTQGNATTTILVEPLLRDPTNLYIDVDVQHAGPIELDRISAKVREVGQFATGTLKPLLEAL